MSTEKEIYKVIGMMSGTSLDGLDMVACIFKIKNGNWSYEIIDAKTINYSDKWRKRLKKAHRISHKALAELDEKYGEYIAKKTNDFVKASDFKPHLIASHGHTVFHEPQNGVTKQIGSGEVISQLTKLTVVHDFRTQDVKMGGQGAPLVPVGDRLLFSEYTYCLNLGGFANISFEKMEKGSLMMYVQ